MVNWHKVQPLLSSFFFNSFPLSFRSAPIPSVPQNSPTSSHFVSPPLVAITQLCYCFTLQKGLLHGLIHPEIGFSGFSTQNVPFTGDFCFLPWNRAFFACGVLPAKCFFVIRSSQISTLPQQICNWTKPGPSVTNCRPEFTAEMKWHSCGVSVTVHVYKSVRRGEVEIETGDKVPFCFCLHVT